MTGNTCQRWPVALLSTRPAKPKGLPFTVANTVVLQPAFIVEAFESPNELHVVAVNSLRQSPLQKAAFRAPAGQIVDENKRRLSRTQQSQGEAYRPKMLWTIDEGDISWFHARWQNLSSIAVQQFDVGENPQPLLRDRAIGRLSIKLNAHDRSTWKRQRQNARALPTRSPRFQNSVDWDQGTGPNEEKHLTVENSLGFIVFFRSYAYENRQTPVGGGTNTRDGERLLQSKRSALALNVSRQA
jgi:hypothetical protein